MCACLSVYLYTAYTGFWGLEVASDPWELELQAVVNCLVWARCKMQEHQVLLTAAPSAQPSSNS